MILAEYFLNLFKFKGWNLKVRFSKKTVTNLKLWELSCEFSFHMKFNLIILGRGEFYEIQTLNWLLSILGSWIMSCKFTISRKLNLDNNLWTVNLIKYKSNKQINMVRSYLIGLLLHETWMIQLNLFSSLELLLGIFDFWPPVLVANFKQSKSSPVKIGGRFVAFVG